MLFGIGLVWESLNYLGNLVSIMTFPTGRLGGLPAKLVVAGGVVAALENVALIAMLPQTGAGGAISGCRGPCPRNGLAFAPDPARALDLGKPSELCGSPSRIGTAAVLTWRIATATPPQRRALAIGTPIALLFMAFQASFLTLRVLDAHPSRFETKPAVGLHDRAGR